MALVVGDAGNNALSGTAVGDRILGHDGNDRLQGLAGNDIIDGGNGLDSLYGGLGNDLLLGGLGNDLLFGNDGRDTLVGGLGRDIMNGGAGADIYRFDDMDAGDATAGPLSDVIQGFSSDDVIDLMDVDILDSAFGSEPRRGAFSIWYGGGSTFITWNTFNGFHDIELAGYLGDPSSQIRWYEDDYLANVHTTGRISAGQTREGTIEIWQDADWFRITVSKNQIYTFEVQGQGTGGGSLQSPYLTLYDAAGHRVDEGYDYDPIQLAGASGTYYLEASGFGDTGTYTVAASGVVDDFASDASTRGRIAAGHTREGEVEALADADWFRISLTEGVTYAINLRGADSGSGTLSDPFVVLRNAKGIEIAADDDGSGTRDSLLTFTAKASGTYFIEAGDSSDGIGTYELSVEVVDSLLV